MIVLLVGIALATTQLIFNLSTSRQAAFLLSRAEISYRQLAAYQMLSVATLEYILGPDKAKHEQIDDGLSKIDRLTKYEADLIEANGGIETNSRERQRLKRMAEGIRGLYVAETATVTPSAREMGAAYARDVKPLMVDAIAGEEREVREVEGSMRSLEHAIAWTGPLGATLQSGALLLIVFILARFILRPISGLVADIKEFGRGRLAHRVSVVQRDEFGLLAQYINRMAGKLERGRDALMRSNEHLEDTVAERTRELRERSDDLKEIDDSRRRFFADVSHELRTPLTAIVGEAEVTLRAPQADVDQYRTSLAAIRANATFLDRRIEDLMALARSLDGRLELLKGQTDLNGIAAEACAEAQSLAKLHAVSVELTSVDRSIPIDADRRRIRQALMILLDNAVKFSRPRQSIRIVTSVAADIAEIEVIDSGRGIPVAELPRIFERFYQTEVGRQMGGTGLGLAIARRIIEAHDGDIKLQSNATGGTTATMSFPLLEGRPQ